MKKWYVSISEPAEHDLDSIYKHITESLLEPVIAWNQIERIREAIFKLDQMPERFPLYQEEPWLSLGIRRMNIDNYAVFYLIDDSSNSVSVVSVIYSRRNIPGVLNNQL